MLTRILTRAAATLKAPARARAHGALATADTEE